MKSIKNKKIYIALQTWTIQRQLLLEPTSVLDEISSIGFDYLELAGTAGRPPKDFSRLCKDSKLKIIGIHQPHLRSKNLQKLIAEIKRNCEVFKPKYVTITLNPHERLKTKSYIEYAKLCKNVSEALSDKKIILCYHCFSYDFVPLPDNPSSLSGLDILLNNTSPQTLSFELDTYFIFRSRIPYRQILEKCSDRCKAVHVCDIDEGEMKRMDVGNGNIDWPTIISDFVKLCQVRLFVIENRIGTPLESIKRSYNHFMPIVNDTQQKNLSF